MARHGRVRKFRLRLRARQQTNSMGSGRNKRRRAHALREKSRRRQFAGVASNQPAIGPDIPFPAGIPLLDAPLEFAGLDDVVLVDMEHVRAAAAE